MGMFDTLFYKDKSIQVKAFSRDLKRYFVGRFVPCKKYGENFTIYFSPKLWLDFSPDATGIFAVFKNKRFTYLTVEKGLTIAPYYDKYGIKLNEKMEEEENDE